MPRIILPWAAQTAATRLAGIVRQPKLRQPALLRDIGIANQYARGMSVALVGAAMRGLRPFDAVSCSMGSTTPSAEVQNGMSGWRLTGTDNNSYVELQGPALSAGSRYETVCATFVVNSNSTGNYGAIASKCDLSQSLNGWCLFVENGGWIRIYAKDGGSQVVNTASSRTFNDGKVHTVVATFGKVSGDQVLVYVDGVLEISTTIGGSWGYNSPVFRLGNVADSYWGEFIGTIFQFTAWNRALSDVEAYALSRQPWTMFLSDTPFSLPLQSAPTATRWTNLRNQLQAKKQPRRPVRVDRSNPLARGIVSFRYPLLPGKSLAAMYCAVLDRIVDIRSTLNNSEFVGTKDGLAAYSGTTGGGWEFVDASYTSGLQTFSQLAIINVESLAAVRAISTTYGASTGGAEWRINPTGEIELLKSSVASIGTSSGAGIQTNKTAVVGVSYSSPDAAFYSNGSPVGTASSAQTFNLGYPTLLNSGSTTQEPFKGYITLHIVWNRVLSPSEFAAISKNPWQLLREDFPVAFALSSAQNDFTALLSEGASLTDAIIAVLGISASATEATTLADTLDGGLALGVAATESVTLADSESVVYGISSSITESMTISDAVSLIYGLSSAVSEALALDAAQDRDTSGAFSAAQTDSSSLGVSAAAAFAAFPVISEALALADALSGAMAASADAGDALTLDEAATRVLGLISQASEASALDDLSDSVRGVTGGVTEALTATSGQAAALSSFARIDESMTLSEFAGSAKGYAVAIVGALALLEALRARLDRAFAAAGARGGRPALDTGSRGGRAASTRLGRTDSSRRTRH